MGGFPDGASLVSPFSSSSSMIIISDRDLTNRLDRVTLSVESTRINFISADPLKAAHQILQSTVTPLRPLRFTGGVDPALWYGFSISSLSELML